MPAGTRFFFYGTLCDADVRTRVLGASTATRVATVPATAPGWRAVYACGHPFPVLVPCREDAAPGLLVEGLDRAAVRRLVAYENSGYRIGWVGVRVERRPPLSVCAFLPTPALRPGPMRFDLDGWRKAYHAAYLRRLS